MSVSDKVDKAIASHKVAVFSKTYCPYCTSTKSLLASLDIDPSALYVVELDNEADGDEQQAYLAKKSGQRTVPNVFIGGNHIGGLASACVGGEVAEAFGSVSVGQLGTPQEALNRYQIKTAACHKTCAREIEIC